MWCNISANVAQKYKHRPGLRVSRGAFVWIYVNTQSQAAESTPVPPSESVVEYVLMKQNESVVSVLSVFFFYMIYLLLHL